MTPPGRAVLLGALELSGTKVFLVQKNLKSLDCPLTSMILSRII